MNVDMPREYLKKYSTVCWHTELSMATEWAMYCTKREPKTDRLFQVSNRYFLINKKQPVPLLDFFCSTNKNKYYYKLEY